MQFCHKLHCNKELTVTVDSYIGVLSSCSSHLNLKPSILQV